MTPMPLLLLVPSLVGAQTPSPSPIISFPEPSFSFGKVAAHQKVTHAFKLINTGTAPLTLKDVKASCGCTSVVAGKWTLAPGESTTIEASFNSGNFHGVVRKSITVTSDDPVTPIANLHFDADVIPEPPPAVRSVSLLDVDRGAVQKTVVRFNSGAGNAVRLKGVVAPEVPYLSGVMRAEGDGDLLEIQLDGRLIPKGKNGGTDVLSVLSAEGKTSIPIQVEWTVKPAVTASPAFVALAGKAGDPLKAVVKLQDLKGRSFRILEAKASNPSILVALPKGKASTHPELKISLSPQAKAGTYADERVLLTLDDPDQSELSIRVSAVLR